MRRIMFLALFSVVFMSGCANQMAFHDHRERLTTDSKPVFLMTATLNNNYRKSFQPKLTVAHVEKESAAGEIEKLSFLMDDRGSSEGKSESSGNDYFVRLELERGQYIVRSFHARASSFPIMANYTVPIHAPLNVVQGGVYYLGHIAATIRERNDDEFKAGSAMPLIDQAIGGASGGTFDVAISDEFAIDEPKFRARFRALEGVPIHKAILPPFDRTKAQEWCKEPMSPC